MNTAKKEMPRDSGMTKEESENIDLAEKGIQSPLNPTSHQQKVDQKDKETILSQIKDVRKKEDSRKLSQCDENPIVNKSDNPDPNKSQAV